MAVRDYNERPSGAVWEGLEAGDTGQPYELGGLRGVVGAVQVEGISGHTVTIQISNDGVTYYTATQADNATPVSFAADGLQEFTTGARWIRPSVASGTGAAVVTLNFQN
jgi:hypothetical protein